MTELDIFIRLLLALALGAIVGIEREKFAKKYDTMAFGGIRTFMFISLLGALSALLSQEYYEWIIIPILFGLIIFIGLSYYLAVKITNGKSIGITGEIAALLTFIIGFLSLTDHILITIAIAIIVTTFLYLKIWMHKILKIINETEVYSALIFGILAFVILPFLPNQTYGPFDVFNPYKIWLMIVFISGMSFIGYILIKIFDSKKGLALTGILGGIVSSTAVTISLSGKSKEEKNAYLIKLLLFGVLIANTIMIIRVLIEVFVLNRELLKIVAIPLIVMMITALMCALYSWFTRDKIIKEKEIREENDKITHESPLNIGTALKFGILFGIILFVIKIAQIYFGKTGIYIASIVSGFVDVDAIVLSVASSSGADIPLKVAATAITLAVMSNILIKFVYASLFGSKQFRTELGIMMGIIILSGITAIILL
ncbi:MAG: MgtC/SapB family protein [Candidatus Woesearchaeota archaeon]